MGTKRMKIKTLRLDNFRRFSDFELEFQSQLTVLVARNGAGKTSILDALAIALGPFLSRLPGISGLGFRDTDFQVDDNGHRPPFMRISVCSEKDLRWDRTEKRDKTRKTIQQIPEAEGIKQLTDYVDSLIDAYNDKDPLELPVFAYYGTGRGVFEVPQRKRGFGKEFSRFDALKGALESRTNFRGFVEYFYALEDIESRKQREARSFEVDIPELSAIRAAVTKMLPEFSSPRGAEPAGIKIDWQQDDDHTKTLRIEQLSDGYRTTLAMVMDIAARMAEANPEMDDPLLTEGVVMIDEVDLHLHPSWQQTILLDLMRTFPKIQFIVSTHSPQVLSSVQPSSVRVIDWQNDKPVLVPVQFSEGAEAQKVLLDILKVDSARVEALPIVEDLKRYQKLVSDDRWDSVEALQLRKKLDRWGGEYEPELTRLDMDIRMKEWDRTQ